MMPVGTGGYTGFKGLSGPLTFLFAGLMGVEKALSASYKRLGVESLRGLGGLPWKLIYCIMAHIPK